MIKRTDQADINLAYEIDGIQIPWLQPATQARAQIQHLPVIPNYQGKPGDKVVCQSAFGLKTISADVPRQQPNTPVLRVGYELAPVNADASTVNPNEWLRQLTTVFNLPPSSDIEPYQVDPSLSGRVIYSQQWDLENVRITLSTYGGYRENKLGQKSIAGLIIHWTNTQRIAEPFLAPVEKLEQTVQADDTEQLASQILRVKKVISPYYTPDYGSNTPHFAKDHPPLRRAQRVLHAPQLFDTPANIADLLSNKSVLVWHCHQLDVHVLSNKWDSVLIHRLAAKNRISHINLLPARGAGVSYLSANGLTIADTPNSQSIAKLASILGRIQGKQVACRTDYDC